MRTDRIEFAEGHALAPVAMPTDPLDAPWSLTARVLATIALVLAVAMAWAVMR